MIGFWFRQLFQQLPKNLKSFISSFERIQSLFFQTKIKKKSNTIFLSLIFLALIC